MTVNANAWSQSGSLLLCHRTFRHVTIPNRTGHATRYRHGVIQKWALFCAVRTLNIIVPFMIGSNYGSAWIVPVLFMYIRLRRIHSNSVYKTLRQVGYFPIEPRKWGFCYKTNHSDPRNGFKVINRSGFVCINLRRKARKPWHVGEIRDWHVA